ncbi:hypothetical protein BJX64DRAFT_291121 [Aspergillus heterothallicus]
MLNVNVEILESHTSFNDRPEVLCYLRSLSGHPKIKSCLNLMMAVLSNLDPLEASQLLEEVRNDSRFLSTFQVWSEVPQFYPNPNEHFFDSANPDVFVPPSFGERVDPNSEGNHNILCSQGTPLVNSQATALGSPMNRFPLAGEEFDLVLDEISQVDQSIPFQSTAHTACADPVAEIRSETYPPLIPHLGWYDICPQNIPADLLGPGGLDPAVVEWLLQPFTAQPASHYLTAQEPTEREPSKSMQFEPGPAIIESVIFKPLDSAFTREATTMPCKPKKKPRTRKRGGLRG